MNKYQEALNKLKNEPVYYESDDGRNILEDVFSEEMSILQELIDQTKTPTEEEIKKKNGKRWGMSG